MILLCADPAKVTGLAALVTSEVTKYEVIWAATWEIKFSRLPAPASKVHKAALTVIEAVYDRFGVLAESHDWCFVAEAMFVGANSGSAFADARLTGQLYQALEMGVPGMTFGEAKHYQATQWRTVLGKGVGQMKGPSAKPLAVEHVRRRFGLEVSDHEAEAVCLGLYRLHQLEKEAKDAQIREIARRTTKLEA